MGRSRAATKLASATGIRLRGFHSKSRSSTASSTAAIGVAKVADMPPGRPRHQQRLPLGRRQMKCLGHERTSDPPVMMIGPSAPNGPPDPIEIADDSGLSTATLGCIRLLPIKIASIASGMPCPRIRSEP